MIKQEKSHYWSKLNALLRYSLAHTVTQTFPLYIVNEYPKSGASWIGEMLSDVLDVPFPRNRLPMLRSSILHGHMMHKWNMHNVLLVWRDGRDVLISQYFHYLFENDRGNALLVEKCRAELDFHDYEDITRNLVPFMEYVFEKKQHPRFSWVDFVDRWGNCDCCTQVRYEDMRLQPVSELQRISSSIAGIELEYKHAVAIVEKYSFKNMSGRNTGEEKKHSFMRKGVIGDWNNNFNQEARQKFNEYAGNSLIKLGYETSSEWVNPKCD